MLAQELILDLIERTRLNINEVEKFKQKPTLSLNHKVNENSWSVLECIEHLNRYSDFYLPELEQQIKRSKTKPSNQFKGGWLGAFFIKSIDPDRAIKKMKTLKEMNPLGSDLDNGTLDKFLSQQHDLLAILNTAKNVNLDKTKTRISISKFLKLRLGDTLKFVVLHNQRHIKQAKNSLKL